MPLVAHPLSRQPSRGSQPLRILVLNPNSSQAMTTAMSETLCTLQTSGGVEIETYTAPSGPASINDDHDIDESANTAIEDLDDQVNYHRTLATYDGILVACYSVHPLVTGLGALTPPRWTGKQPLITSIFEASVLTAMSLLSVAEDAKWGIITTGQWWESHLAEGVHDFLGLPEGSPATRKFAGVFSTGLTAGDFHGGISQEVIRSKLKEAAKQLLQAGSVDVIVMGCAGMAGLEDLLREAAIEEYGQAATYVHIVDAVKAGVLQLEHTIRASRAFRIQSHGALE